jgi:hypothetical protein
MIYNFSRVDWIRTSDPLHPIQVRYRAAPLPELIWASKLTQKMISLKQNHQLGYLLIHLSSRK